MRMTKKLLSGKPFDAFFNLRVFGLECLNIQSLTRLWGYPNLMIIFSMSNKFWWKVHHYLLPCFLKKYQVDDELRCLFSQSSFYVVQWHPLKGPCQEKTPLHRKKWCLFLQGQYPAWNETLLFVCARVFNCYGVNLSLICYQAPIRIKAIERKSKNWRLRSGEIFIIS